MSEAPRLTRPFELGTLGERPVAVEISATPEEKAAIGAELRLPSFPDLSARFEISRGSGGIIRVEGRVLADIVQSCVVSLEPVPQHIDEQVDRRFVQSSARATAMDDDDPGRHAEIRVDPEDDEPPESIVGSTLDLGAIAMEHFVLAIDPYPRSPDAALPAESVRDEAAASPFAVLDRLRKKGGD